MFGIHEEVSGATRERLVWQLAVGTMLGETTVRALRQVTDLNLALLRATLEQGNLATRQLLAAQDARQFLSLAEAQVHPGALRSLDYGYYLATIIAETQAGVIRALGGSIAEAGREWGAVAAHVSGNGPHGWKAGLAFLRDAAESAWRMPADVARAVRLALNINVPAGQTGKLRIAYTGPGRAGK